MTKSNGFSIFELIVVLSIISLLSLIVVPSYTKIQDHAKKVASQTNLKTFQTSLENYFLETAQYPAQTLDGEALYALLHDAGYLESPPINPYTKKAYTSSDTNGKIVYQGTSTQIYSMEVYSKTGDTVDFSLKNI